MSLHDSNFKPVSAEAQERLIDQLLREELGTDISPDLTDRIMMQVHGAQANRNAANAARGGQWLRSRWMPALAAAMLLMAAGVWWISRPEAYPGPTANGSYVVAEGGALRRGATLVTQASAAAQVALGGYVNMTVAPDSRLRIDGDTFNESVFLEKGEVTSQIDKHQGTFVVVTDQVQARVTGTKFSVSIAMDRDASGANIKRTTVKVIEGSVQVTDRGGLISNPVSAVQVMAGASVTYPPIAPPPAATAEGAKPPVSPATTPNLTPPANKPVTKPVKPFPTTYPRTTRPATTRRDGPNRVEAEGEITYRGQVREMPDGWFVMEENGRKTLFLPREQYPKAGVHFLTDSTQYYITMKNGRFVRGESIGTQK